MMSSSKKRRNTAIIVRSEDLNIGEAANENMPETQIRDCLRENEERIKRGERPTGQQLAFWRSFTAPQIRNAEYIYAGFQRTYASSGLRTQNYTFMPRGQMRGSERSTRAEALFSEWARKGYALNVSVTAILEILVFGYSCRHVDQSHQKRKGFARGNLIAGLELYENLKSRHTTLEKMT